jgi:hypothetical protein
VAGGDAELDEEVELDEGGRKPGFLESMMNVSDASATKSSARLPPQYSTFDRMSSLDSRDTCNAETWSPGMQSSTVYT